MGGGVGVMGGDVGDVVVAELAAVESDAVCCVSVSDKFDWSSMLFVELQYRKCNLLLVSC